MTKENHLEEMRNIVALQTNNLKHFLLPWLSFRLHISFKPPDKKRRHFYGNEHGVTLNQLRAGHKDNVVLDKYKGYTDLINLVEKTWKGKWQAAAIYMRSEMGGPFDVEVRRYYRGEIENENSPVIHHPLLKLYFHGITDNQPVFRTEPLPDFSDEISTRLKAAEA